MIQLRGRILYLSSQPEVVGEHLAQEIGQDYKVGKINPLQHKLLHAGVGGFAGALMNPADPLHGAASGALSALVAETAADHLMGQTAASTMARYIEDCRRTGEVPTENGYYNQLVGDVAGHPKLQMMVPSSDHARAKERVAMIAKIAGAAGAFLAGLDPNIAFRAAENAIENNFLLPVFLRNNDPAMLADSEEWMAEHIKNQAETEEMMAAVGEVALEVGLAGLQKVPIVGPIVGATKGFLKKGAGAARMAAKSAAKKAAAKPAVQVKSAPVRSAKPVKAEQPEVVKAGVSKPAKKEISQSKIHLTYVKPHPAGGKPYIGRTSGKVKDAKDPLELKRMVKKRDRNHHMNKEGFGPAKLDKSSPNPQAIRGQEQRAIDQLGGAQSKGGTSSNKINSISDKNPKKSKYIEAAKKEFGHE